ncbi:MAG TPA: aminodeoxychorismate/anthranilate synthase component II [Polyangiaceae bacterium]|nr:aminodeoxychorismate/anthranilate synthase component II [Polyangiaceae bacterium]
MTHRLLVLDNYDSFTFNLVQMFRHYDLETCVVRSDKIEIDEVRRQSPDYIVISPGPKAPASAGISVELIRALHGVVPILGVCLGMQCINEAFGGVTVRAPLPVHGKTSPVVHTGKGLFAQVPSPFQVARYHSLAVSGLSPELEVSATSNDGVVMAIEHRSARLSGVQFHPESFLTEHGFKLVENFLASGAKGMV